jgi:uncharacterized protein (DUF486 family)
VEALPAQGWHVPLRPGYDPIGRSNVPGRALSRAAGAARAAASTGLTEEGTCCVIKAISAWPHLAPVLLLLGSNVFMTVAWYGHLKFKSTALVVAIVASWSIALVEYCMAVPANRIGHAVYSAAELKTMQEVITLLVFAGFSVVYLKEPLTWNHAVGFMLIAAGAAFVFSGRA